MILPAYTMFYRVVVSTPLLRYLWHAASLEVFPNIATRISLSTFPRSDPDHIADLAFSISSHT